MSGMFFCLWLLSVLTLWFYIFIFFRFGIYPLTAYALDAGPVRLTTYQPQSPTGSMDQSIPSDRSSAGPVDVEVRRIVNMMCNIKPRDDAQNDFMVSLILLCIILFITSLLAMSIFIIFQHFIQSYE
jgi:hypothetical protein